MLRRRGSPNAGGSYDRPLARQSGQAYVPAYSELQYKKPKKKFNSKEEKMEYVRSYMAKEKTEVSAGR